MPETGTPFDKLFLILEEFRGDLTEIKDRLARLEGREPQAPQPAPTPLDAFVRPPAGTPPHGLGVQMREPDVQEAIKRACHGVNWRGDQRLTGQRADLIWSIIDRLKVADPAILPYYKMLDPTLCGIGLLSAVIPAHPEDAYPFSPTRSVREGFAGQSAEEWLRSQLAVTGTPGIA